MEQLVRASGACRRRCDRLLYVATECDGLQRNGRGDAISRVPAVPWEVQVKESQAPAAVAAGTAPDKAGQESEFKLLICKGTAFSRNTPSFTDLAPELGDVGAAGIPYQAAKCVALSPGLYVATM
jgi:hypothetical protein